MQIRHQTCLSHVHARPACAYQQGQSTTDVLHFSDSQMLHSPSTPSRGRPPSQGLPPGTPHNPRPQTKPAGKQIRLQPADWWSTCPFSCANHQTLPKAFSHAPCVILAGSAQPLHGPLSRPATRGLHTQHMQPEGAWAQKHPEVPLRP